LVELLLGIGFVYIHQWFVPSGITISFFAAILLFCASVGIFVADLKTEYIPEVFLYAGFVSVVILLFPSIVPCFTGAQASCTLLMNTYIFPASIGAGFFFLLWLLSKGKAMGDGDIYVAGIIGMALGYPRLIVAYYVAFLTGAIVGVILILVRKKGMKSHIPFGPFLILGLGITSIYGAHIVLWWSQLWYM
jgi:prepilin signal peptidase PulO-like enzyme (type II secretory pathway)